LFISALCTIWFTTESPASNFAVTCRRASCQAVEQSEGRLGGL
jgi:hypothetical protein